MEKATTCNAQGCPDPQGQHEMIGGRFCLRDGARHLIHTGLMPLTERELMTVATMVRRRRGAWAAAWICGRIADLERTGDTAGADTWADVLARLGEIESSQIGTLQ